MPDFGPYGRLVEDGPHDGGPRVHQDSVHPKPTSSRYSCWWSNIAPHFRRPFALPSHQMVCPHILFQGNSHFFVCLVPGKMEEKQKNGKRLLAPKYFLC